MNKPTELEIVHRLPAKVTVVDASKPNEASIDVELAADADVGIYPLRVRTADGISRQLFFAVGLFADVAVTSAAHADGQLVDPKVALNGNIRPAARDGFVVQLKQDQRLVAEVESARLGVGIDPVIEVLDPKGNRVAWCDDAFGLGSDPRVHFVAKTAGAYRIYVHDATYQRGGSYRLKLGDFPFAEGVMPPVATAGAESEAMFWGGTIVKPKTMKWRPRGTPGGWTTIAQPCEDSAALPIPVSLSGRAGLPASYGDDARSLGGYAASGQLTSSGPTEALRFAAQPKQRWRVELVASRIGSKLDGLLVVRDGSGRDLAAGEASAGNDPVIDVAVPEGVKELVAYVEDTTGRTGPQAYYHVRATPEADDYSIELVNAAVNVPVDGYELARFRIQRRQYGGPIQLFLTSESSGLRAEGGYIEAGQNEGFLALTANGAAGNRPVLAIAGRAGSPANPMDRAASLDRTRMNRWCPSELQDDFPVAATRPAPLSVRPNSRVVKVLHGMPTDIGFTVVRKPEYKQAEVELAIESLREFRDQVKELKIGKELATATLRLPAKANLPVGKRLLVLSGYATLGAERTPVTAPPITLSFERPYSLEILTPTVRVQRGGKTTVECLLRRVAPFAGEVEVRALDLPRGLTAAPLTMPADKAIVQLLIAASDTPDGVYTIKLTAATAMGGPKQTKDYQLPPQEITVQVGQAKAPDRPAKSGKAKRKAAAKKGT